MALVCTTVATKFSIRCGVVAHSRRWCRIGTARITDGAAVHQIATFEMLAARGYTEIYVLAHSIGSYFCMQVNLVCSSAVAGGMVLTHGTVRWLGRCAGVVEASGAPRRAANLPAPFHSSRPVVVSEDGAPLLVPQPASCTSAGVSPVQASPWYSHRHGACVSPRVTWSFSCWLTSLHRHPDFQSHGRAVRPPLYAGD